MAWAFQDPEHGSTTSKGSAAPTTTFVNPEYQPVTNRSQVSYTTNQHSHHLSQSYHELLPNWLGPLPIATAGVTIDQKVATFETRFELRIEAMMARCLQSRCSVPEQLGVNTGSCCDARGSVSHALCVMCEAARVWLPCR